MAQSLTPPPLQGPTAKEKKYDRQLRLWAASGQKALEEAHLLLLNNGAGVAGIETLKNLVLPGVGNFTIVDEREVQEEDLGVNFFLTENSLGHSRAEECCKYLEELNPEVKGNAIQGSISDFIRNLENLHPYTLILVTSPIDLFKTLEPLAKYAWDKSIPLFYLHSNGFYSHFSIQLPEQFPIVDTHPDPVTTEDLRLLSPWPELLEFMEKKTKDLGTISDHDHGHIPYVLLLLYYLEQWKGSHEGKYPGTYSEKSAFRATVKDGARTNNSEGGEENFDEAVAAVLKSLNPPSISSGLRAVFDSPHCQTPSIKSANFWLIAHTIRSFYQRYSVLPLPGNLPDMKAISNDYISLQNIYKAKARADLAEVTSHIRSLEETLNRLNPITTAEIEAFCKNAPFVKLILGKQLHIPREPGRLDCTAEYADSVLRSLDMEDSLMPLYLSYLALDYHIDTEGPLIIIQPTDVTALESQQRKLKWSMTQYTETLIEKLRKIGTVEIDAESAQERISEVIMELARAAGSELHNISAFTGGMVAQEVIKVVTKQYVPVDNTCLFDGVTSRTGILRV